MGQADKMVLAERFTIYRPETKKHFYFKMN
jgi:hypothetical protein